MSERDPVLGDLSLLPRSQEHEVKGNLLAARARYVRETFGQPALDKLVARVPEPARRHLVEGPLPFSWYPIGDMIEIDRQIATGPMRGDVARMRAFGNEIARYDLPTIYKVLFKIGTPAFVLKRIGVVYRTYLRGGTAHAEQLDERKIKVSFRDAVFPLYFCAHGISGWLAASVELSGGTRVDVEHAECVHAGDAACSWIVSWR